MSIKDEGDNKSVLSRRNVLLAGTTLAAASALVSAPFRRRKRKRRVPGAPISSSSWATT
jgi:hypothetical protein